MQKSPQDINHNSINLQNGREIFMSGITVILFSYTGSSKRRDYFHELKKATERQPGL